MSSTYTVHSLVSECLADGETPVSVYQRLPEARYRFLLESVEGGENWGRYSLLGNAPAVVVWGDPGAFHIRFPDSGEEELHTGTTRELLAELHRRFRPATTARLPDIFAAWVGYFGYDLVFDFEEMERRLPPRADGQPQLCLMLPRRTVIFDNVAKRLRLVANVVVEEGGDAAAAAARGEAELAELRALLDRPAQAPGLLTLPELDDLPDPVSNMDRATFCGAIERIRRYIRAGDIFQAVFSQRFSVPVDDLGAILLYRVLRAINPSPYLFCLELDGQALVGSSPEVLVRVTGREVIVRPIAGTRPRGVDHAEDQRLEAELLADPKERAEHLMLVDLGRNDVGRISRPGSVRVDELMVIERYSHVMHIVSNVVGELADGVDSIEALPACFPAGTVSGAPKIRAMEIIEELEPDRRGSYAGAVGYLTLDGDLDTCITLRTVRLADGQAEVQAGAGIVADSVAENEFEETENKARGMVQAIARALAIHRGDGGAP